MCVAKTPKISDADQKAAEQKPLPILRNPLLDGMLGNIAALRGGRNALRIDLINPLAIPSGGSSGGVGGGAGGGGGSSSGSSSSSSGTSGGSAGRFTKYGGYTLGEPA